MDNIKNIEQDLRTINRMKKLLEKYEQRRKRRTKKKRHSI